MAHLIRKAIAISGAINQKAAQIGKFILKELKDLISCIANGEEKSSSTVRMHLSLLKGNSVDGQVFYIPHGLIVLAINIHNG